MLTTLLAVGKLLLAGLQPSQVAMLSSRTVFAGSYQLSWALHNSCFEAQLQCSFYQAPLRSRSNAQLVRAPM
jgi:hypothetical protein